MGYDETDRARPKRGRDRQPVKRMNDREVPYRRNREPGNSEPGLNLITDSFRNRGRRTGESPRAGGHRASAGPSVSSGGRLSEGPIIMSGRRTLSGVTGQEGHRESGRTDGHSQAVRQTAAARSVSSGRRTEDTGKKRRGRADRGPEHREREAGRSSIYEDPVKRRAKKRRQKIRIILLEALIFIGVLIFAGYSYLNNRLGLMQRLPWNPDEIRNVDISEEKQEQMKGYWTIAIFGVDSRNTSVGKGNNSDVNIICNINQDTGEIKLVSVFRDSYLNVNDKNSYNKINTAYLHGGPEQAVKALNKNLDLDIDDYATFNWKAVADAINILGGIDVEISKNEFYYINAFISETVSATGVGSHQLKQAGMNHLDGVQAVAYGRLRLMDTDYARTERQRKVIALAFEKARAADWATINNIIQTVFPQVATSVDMGDLLAMGRSITKYYLAETMGFPSARGELKLKSKGACVIPQTLESNVVELHKFLFGDEDYTPTETVKAISQRIISDSGLSRAAKPAGEAGTGGGSVPRASGVAEKGAKESTSEELQSKEESEADEYIFPYGAPENAAERETDSRGNLILPSGGYETEEEYSQRPKNPWEAAEETKEREEYPAGTAAYPSEVPKDPSEIPGGEVSQPGAQTDTGVIIAPGTVTPGGASGTGAGVSPSAGVNPGVGVSPSAGVNPGVGVNPSAGVNPGAGMSPGVSSGTDAPGAGGQKEPTAGRVEFYDP